MTNKLIEIQDLSAGYDGIPVIRNIDLTVYDYDFMGIIGPNGGGKTTLIKVILGLLTPMTGSVSFYRDGRKTDDIGIGYLPQRNNIDHRFPITVEDVILSGLIGVRPLFGRIDAEKRDRVSEVLEMTGMTDFRSRAIGELSGGQMQRVLLGRAIVNRPQLLILDEPNSYIDKRFEDRLYELLAELNKTTTILMVSHEVTSLVDMVNRTICVDQTLQPVDLTCPYHHTHPFKR
ncbi:MAG: metal ABC transporter ATP-binding protein [Bacteroidales bacterium]